MKKYILSLLVLILSFAGASKAIAAAYNEDLTGRILLQVMQHGEAWYVNPADGLRYYLGRPADALKIMSKLSLGVSHGDLLSFNGIAPAKLKGGILLDVEDRGKAYYANPTDLKLYYLGRPADAFKIMRELGLGITDRDLAKIPAAAAGNAIAPVDSGAKQDSALSAMEQKVFNSVNRYRVKAGLSILVWNEAMAEQARIHSQDMASGKEAFGHNGFVDRTNNLKKKVSSNAFVENVAYNQGYSAPGDKAVEQWLASPGHKQNIAGDYKITGIGIAKNAKGEYYFTQIFAN